MLITIEDYKLLTGKALADDEVARVEALLKAVVEYIENILGYSLTEEEITEIHPYRKTIYLNCRPVIEVKKISKPEHFREGKNYIEFPNFKDCLCYDNNDEIEIIYVKGYRELPSWLKLEIVGLLDEIISSMSEESRYTSYKIDDISYTIRDLVASKKDKLNNIARLIYG